MNDTCNAALAVTFQMQTTAAHDLQTQKTAVKYSEEHPAESSKYSESVLWLFMQVKFSYHI